MKRRPLPIAERAGLGVPTIMEPRLAAKHGARYVHLAVFAIDVDRVRDEVETEARDGAWPFGWEVLVTEAWLVRSLDPGAPADRELVEDLCESAMARSLEHPGEVLGAQLPFAVWDAVARSVWSRELRPLFSAWKTEPRELGRDLARLHTDGPAAVARLARAALDVVLDPPIAEPSRAALETLAAG